MVTSASISKIPGGASPCSTHARDYHIHTERCTLGERKGRRDRVWLPLSSGFNWIRHQGISVSNDIVDVCASPGRELANLNNDISVVFHPRSWSTMTFHWPTVSPTRGWQPRLKLDLPYGHSLWMNGEGERGKYWENLINWIENLIEL